MFGRHSKATFSRSILAPLSTALLVSCTLAAPSPRLELKSLSVTVVGTDSNDPRRAAVGEAVPFWNQELANAGVDVRLGPVAQLVQPVPDDTLRRLSEAVLGGSVGA